MSLPQQESPYANAFDPEQLEEFEKHVSAALADLYADNCKLIDEIYSESTRAKIDLQEFHKRILDQYEKETRAVAELEEINAIVKRRLDALTGFVQSTTAPFTQPDSN